MKNKRPRHQRKKEDKNRKPTRFNLGSGERLSHVIRGTISVNSRAVGFIENEKDKEDVMIETPGLNTALNRDEVEVELLKGTVRGRQIGRVVRVIKRSKMRFVGTVEERGTKLVLVPDDYRMYAPIVIPRPLKEAQKDYKALVEIKEWEIGKEPFGGNSAGYRQKGRA